MLAATTWLSCRRSGIMVPLESQKPHQSPYAYWGLDIEAAFLNLAEGQSTASQLPVHPGRHQPGCQTDLPHPHVTKASEALIKHGGRPTDRPKLALNTRVFVDHSLCSGICARQQHQSSRASTLPGSVCRHDARWHRAPDSPRQSMNSRQCREAVRRLTSASMIEHSTVGTVLLSYTRPIRIFSN